MGLQFSHSASSAPPSPHPSKTMSTRTALKKIKPSKNQSPTLKPNSLLAYQIYNYNSETTLSIVMNAKMMLLPRPKLNHPVKNAKMTMSTKKNQKPLLNQ